MANPSYKTPSVSEKAFSCPHCHALAKQFWYSALARRLDDDDTPFRIDPDSIDKIANGMEDSEQGNELRAWAKRVVTGRPFLEGKSSDPYSFAINNVWVSSCYNCHDISIWIDDKLIFPANGDAPIANSDLSESVKKDYEEASAILNLSPRGAAALLRLVIQKICVDLGEGGKNLNEDIASLVKKGLDIKIQQALDLVRVIGNSAVHPGEIDLRDDRATAERLFMLVNLIADAMISQPKHVAEMYASLPLGAKEAVDRRDDKGKAA